MLAFLIQGRSEWKSRQGGLPGGKRCPDLPRGPAFRGQL
jgi:hypothetical protein